MDNELKNSVSPYVELKQAIEDQNKKLDKHYAELEIHSVMLDRLCTLKEAQLESDTVFRTSWRYGKIVAVFFMIVAFSFDVIQINSVEPVIDLFISLLS